MQKQKQTQKEVQLELQFYVHQDLENVLGILAETAVSYKLLKNHTDQSYLPIAQNRLILQTNLSNAIQYDQYLNYENNPTLSKQLIDEKKKASENFKKIVYEEKLIDVSDPELMKICEHYLQENLNVKNNLKQLTPVVVKTKASFDAETVQKVIGGIQSVDMQIQEIRNGNYKPPSIDDLRKKIEGRQLHCEKQLRKNFHIPEQIQQQQEIKQEKENLQNQKEEGHAPQQDVTLTKPPQVNHKEEDSDLIQFSDEDNEEQKKQSTHPQSKSQQQVVKQQNEDLLGIENNSDHKENQNNDKEVDEKKQKPEVQDQKNPQLDIL